MASVENGIKVLFELFDNLENTPVCGRYILAMSQKHTTAVSMVSGEKAVWTTITQDLDFCKSLMQFLFSPRTEEHIATLLERLSHCSCDMNNPDIRTHHKFGRFVEERLVLRTGVDKQSPSISFITALFHILLGVLQNTHLKSVAQKTAKRWPTCIEDLMPHGSEKLVESFVAWSRVIPDMVVFRVVFQFIRISDSVLIPSIIDSTLTQCVVDAGRQLFDRTWATLRYRAETRRKQMGKAFEVQLEALAEYLCDIVNRAMLNNCEVKLIQLCSLLIYLADDPRLFLPSREACISNLTSLGLGIYQELKDNAEPVPSIAVHPEICKLEANKALDLQVSAEIENDRKLLLAQQGGHPDLVNRVYHRHTSLLLTISSALTGVRDAPPYYHEIAHHTIFHIRAARYALRCSAPSCPNSIHKIGKDLRRCTGCSLVPYCSTTCQTDAWRSGQFPHRDICKLLREMTNRSQREKEFLFHCENPSDWKKYHIRLVSLLAEAWWAGKVPVSKLLRICRWSSYKFVEASLATKIECQPGYEDYDTIVTELSGTNALLRARHVVLKMRRKEPKYMEDCIVWE